MGDVRYLTDYYDEKIRRIQEINAPLNFVLITDLHAAPDRTEVGVVYASTLRQIQSIRYVLDRCKVDFLICGGDAADDGDRRGSFIAVRAELEKLGLPVHCLVGNHDDVVGGRIFRCGATGASMAGIDLNELHDIWMQSSPTGEDYYHFEWGGYRFVLINTGDAAYAMDAQGRYHLGPALTISQKQLVWLEHDALCTQKPVILLSHVPLVRVWDRGECPGQPNSGMIHAEDAYAIVHAKGNVAAMIFGHIHRDALVDDGGIPAIGVTCARPMEDSAANAARRWGTITEAAFDVVSIKADMMYLTRFGVGENRQCRLAQPEEDK